MFEKKGKVLHRNLG